MPSLLAFRNRKGILLQRRGLINRFATLALIEEHNGTLQNSLCQLVGLHLISQHIVGINLFQLRQDAHSQSLQALCRLQILSRHVAQRSGGGHFLFDRAQIRHSGIFAPQATPNLMRTLRERLHTTTHFGQRNEEPADQGFGLQTKSGIDQRTKLIAHRAKQLFGFCPHRCRVGKQPTRRHRIDHSRHIAAPVPDLTCPFQVSGFQFAKRRLVGRRRTRPPKTQMQQTVACTVQLCLRRNHHFFVTFQLDMCILRSCIQSLKRNSKGDIEICIKLLCAPHFRKSSNSREVLLHLLARSVAIHTQHAVGILPHQRVQHQFYIGDNNFTRRAKARR